jgi:hypothetical protein
MRAQQQARKCEVETKVKGRDAWLANNALRAEAAFRAESDVWLFRRVQVGGRLREWGRKAAEGGGGGGQRQPNMPRNAISREQEFKKDDCFPAFPQESTVVDDATHGPSVKFCLLHSIEA